MSCWTKGCIALLVIGLLFGAFLAWGAYRLYHKALEFTSTAPANLPVQEATAEQYQEVSSRVDAFRQNLQNNAPAELELSAAEINTLIAMDPKNSELKGRLHVGIENNQVLVQFSIPLEKMGNLGKLPGAAGRYLNAAVGAQVEIANGKVRLRPQTIEVNGKQPPAEWMTQLAQGFENSFAQSFEQDPRNKPLLEKIKSLRIEGDKILINK
ncbi:MAG: hypothetical protein HY360_01535 [Verrucomicrobia bacterium]|nr:hypothetical protein [Verrucomicrobiota bacterium]